MNKTAAYLSVPRILLLAALCLASAPSGAEEAAEREERFSELVESLNAPSARRAGILEIIHNELRGPDSLEMQEMLRGALSRSNSLILQGAVEAMAILGDARDVAALGALLATTDKLEVKTLIIRLLPAFGLTSERARFNFIQYAAGYVRAPHSSVLAPLRHPPLTRRGRLDLALERRQNQIARTITAQFDPVGAALRHIDDRLYSQAARQTVQYYVGKGLGNDPGSWNSIWAAQGGDAMLMVPDEVEEIQLTVLLSLSDMGAEGLPEVLAAFRRLLASGDPVLGQAVFETMTVMCRSAFDEYGPLSGMQFDAADEVEAGTWRRRRFASAAGLAAFAAESAGEMLDAGMDAAGYDAAAACLGAALSYPDGFPDDDSRLREIRSAGLAALERQLLMPDISREKRSAVAAALGEVGAERSVQALVSIIDSPYSSADFGPDGTRMAESAVHALRAAATGEGEGRDAARAALLALLEDPRIYPPLRPGTPPVGLAHMALWRLQRLAKSNDTALDRSVWRNRLGWQDGK